MDPVAALPAEIIAKILSFVNQRDLFSLVQVCIGFLYTIQEEEVFNHFK